jgi:uncharacterized pyridoxal phosphate-containing UPF0001 family protein
MAGLDGGPDEALREFGLLQRLQGKHRSDSPDNVELRELSMGIRGEFELAIKAGPTMVRVGSLLFQGT